MPKVVCNHVELYYESHGDSKSPTLMLICGLGDQLTSWKEGFIERFTSAGFHVVTMDNRDAGYSQNLDHFPMPALLENVQRYLSGEEVSADYTLESMAQDVRGLCDHLKIDQIHIAGASMGGMIAQTFACHHSDRCASLTSIMSTTGNRELSLATPEAMQLMLEPAPTEKDAYIEHGVGVRRVLEGGVLPFDEALARQDAAVSYDRGLNPSGFARQLMAILASGDKRRALLGKVSCPALVIHGNADPLVPLDGGQDTADVLPEATLMVIDGLGHALPESTWPEVTNAMIGHMRKATQA